MSEQPDSCTILDFVAYRKRRMVESVRESCNAWLENYMREVTTRSWAEIVKRWNETDNDPKGAA
jgi:hypothetical protein